MPDQTRREFLAAGLTTVLAGRQLRSQSRVERITVNPGEHYARSISSGEILENKLFDITANGATVDITASGQNWTLRNIGVNGQQSTGNAVTLKGRNGTVDTLYLGDGAAAGDSVGVYIDHENTVGPITFRNVHIAGFPNNGIYGSPTVEKLRGGIVHIQDSYFDSNNITQVKLGSPRGPCVVENTVFRTDNDTAPIDGKVNKRALWALDNRSSVQNRVVLKNCDVQGRLVTEPGAIIELQGTRWDGAFTAGGDPHESGDPDGVLHGESAGSPSLQPPNGVPMSAEEAVNGTAQDADSYGQSGYGDGGYGDGRRTTTTTETKSEAPPTTKESEQQPPTDTEQGESETSGECLYEKYSSEWWKHRNEDDRCDDQ